MVLPPTAKPVLGILCVSPNVAVGRVDFGGGTVITPSAAIVAVAGADGVSVSPLHADNAPAVTATNITATWTRGLLIYLALRVGWWRYWSRHCRIPRQAGAPRLRRQWWRRVCGSSWSVVPFIAADLVGAGAPGTNHPRCVRHYRRGGPQAVPGSALLVGCNRGPGIVVATVMAPPSPRSCRTIRCAVRIVRDGHRLWVNRCPRSNARSHWTPIGQLWCGVSSDSGTTPHLA